MLNPIEMKAQDFCSMMGLAISNIAKSSSNWVSASVSVSKRMFFLLRLSDMTRN